MRAAGPHKQMNPPDPSRSPDCEMLGFAPVACVHTGWAILRATGADALAFLHGQLTSDVQALPCSYNGIWYVTPPTGREIWVRVATATP